MEWTSSSLSSPSLPPPPVSSPSQGLPPHLQHNSPSTMTASSLSQPPRRRRVLPWDVLLLVFQESDPSTLASLGSVSLDFLVATSPHLHGSVEISTVEALEKLFCERKQPTTSPPSRINPYSTSPFLKPASSPSTSRRFTGTSLHPISPSLDSPQIPSQFNDYIYLLHTPTTTSPLS
ncbi:hypothetical protein BDY24DRAFT_441530 [Mrakia frigida]|uniref:uncharacterized protein n=1 Tax=Mrakia frigida TaxID=29902 RepID=UPI003FCC1CB3